MQPSDGTPVDLTTGLGALRGIWHDGIARFAGIPYAEAPVGDLRFRPPVARRPWEGVRPADAFGPVAPQNPSIMAAMFGGEAEQWGEDCLLLNVWTPDPRAGAALPVMVWIHGGGFEMGSGSSPLYDGTSFARDGVVLVTVNYRLGALGFLELGHLDPDYAGSGNVGLLDQVAALEWVRDHIAGFGGDPARVTIFGESAGAMSASLLMAMPCARGLFHGVIAESGAAASGRTSEQAAADTGEFMANCGVSSVPELRDLSVEQLLAAHAAMSSSRVADPETVIRRNGNPLAFLPFRPVNDGRVVPEDPLAAISAGSSLGVPLLVGTNSEEWKLFALASPAPADEAQLAGRLELLVSDPSVALETYREEHPGATPAELECAVLTDLVFRVPAARLADAHCSNGPVYQYLWTWQSPAWGGAIGAAHAIEIPFVFDLVEDHRLHIFVGPEAPRSLAHATHESWIVFARSGAPSAGGLPDWPRVDGPGQPVMVLDVDPRIEHDPQGRTRRFWDSAAAVMPGSRT
jgi:para-nitrobenzyl esterase